MAHDLAQALVFSCGHIQAAVALKNELQGAQLEAFNSWFSSVVGSPECAHAAQVCTEGIQGTLGVCRSWIVDIFRSRVDLGKLEDEAILVRHASLCLDIDLPTAIRVMQSLPNMEQNVLELRFLSMWGAFAKDLSNLALLRRRADRKDRKANEDRVTAITDLCGRLRVLEEFYQCEVIGVSLFSKGPNAIKQSLLKQEANDLSATVFHIDGLPAALALGRTFIEQQVKEWSEDALGLCSLMQRTIGGGVQLALPCLLEDAQHAPLLAKLQDPSFPRRCPMLPASCSLGSLCSRRPIVLPGGSSSARSSSQSWGRRSTIARMCP